MTYRLTRPRGEQIIFTSEKTGEHVLDIYLEACEIGDRPVYDLLGDMFNADGSFDGDLIQFREHPDHVGRLQVRIGANLDPSVEWDDITTTDLSDIIEDIEEHRDYVHARYLNILNIEQSVITIKDECYDYSTQGSSFASDAQGFRDAAQTHAQDALDTYNDMLTALGSVQQVIDGPNFALRVENTNTMTTGTIAFPASNLPSLTLGNSHVSATVNSVSLRQADHLYFSDASDWNYDQWAGLAFRSATRSIYLGGSMGAQFETAGAPDHVILYIDPVEAGVSYTHISPFTQAMLDRDTNSDFDSININQSFNGTPDGTQYIHSGVRVRQTDMAGGADPSTPTHLHAYDGMATVTQPNTNACASNAVAVSTISSGTTPLLEGAFHVAMVNAPGGTVNNAHGNNGRVRITDGTVVNAYGTRGDIFQDGGTITNAYLFSGALTSTDVTHKWGLHLTGVDKNHLDGSLTLNGALEAADDVTIDGTLTLNSALILDEDTTINGVFTLTQDLSLDVPVTITDAVEMIQGTTQDLDAGTQVQTLGLRIATSSTHSYNNPSALYATSTFSQAGGFTPYMRGAYVSAVVNAAGADVTVMQGTHNRARIIDGNVNYAYGTRSEVRIEGGDVTNAYGYRSEMDLIGGTIDTSYQVWGVDNTGAATRWGLHIVNSNTNRLDGTLTLNGALSAAGNLHTDMNINADGDVTAVDGTFSGQITAIGNITAGGTGWFDAGLTSNADALFTQDVHVMQDVEIDGALTVDGDFTIGGTLNYTGAVSYSGTLSVGGLTVTGTSNFQSGTQVNGTAANLLSNKVTSGVAQKTFVGTETEHFVAHLMDAHQACYANGWVFSNVDVFTLSGNTSYCSYQYCELL